VLHHNQGTMMKNKEVVGELYRCFRKHDVDNFQQLCSPSIIWQQNRGFPGEGTHQGPTAVLSKVYKAFNIEWKRWSFVIERILDAGDDIVVLGYFSGLKRDNDQRFKLAASHVYSFSDGKVVKFQQFTNDVEENNSRVLAAV
jgi:ketosteroid isomerase-like protein|tara:strand:+ start:1179 stop:1604 length:426 start_codon:yes stop_codon:yes gene_type:complete